MSRKEKLKLAGWVVAAVAAILAPRIIGGTVQPLADALRLVVAAGIGHVIAAFHASQRTGKPANRALEQAQVLLCVAGALMILIVGTSIARALSIAGVASVVRFRTPVKDPRETTILFLELGLGMCCGIGAYGLAAMGTVFICLFLFALSDAASPVAETATLELVRAKEATR